ncbi:hypothetical protein A6A26_08605 [Pantoea sp. OXWO6B1]|nr:hypothetical protein A6A26_08605 [Pantoea sp. OXWO6B1]
MSFSGHSHTTMLNGFSGRAITPNGWDTVWAGTWLMRGYKPVAEVWMKGLMLRPTMYWRFYQQ